MPTEPVAGALDLSYAQHLEDHHLWQAFAGQKTGFYIDVGAGHPVADNVSCWFYLQGWRGLVVEPQEKLVALYERVRPRDIVWCGLAGSRERVADFHLADRLHGFSTLDDEAAAQARLHGAVFRKVARPMRTLTALCGEFAIAEIDFLKIDVEGAEGEVLAGLDLSRLRPRVLCIEAVAPGTMAPNWVTWEPGLLAADYEFVLFEGLNRFYVAREDQGLLARFPRSQAEWLVAPHLGHTNRAPWREDHPDHAFAKRLVGDFLARLPFIDPALLLDLVTRTEDEADLLAPPSEAAKARAIARLFPDSARFPHASAGLAELDAATLRDFYARLIDSDNFRIMAGRLAMSFDGGQILDD